MRPRVVELKGPSQLAADGWGALMELFRAEKVGDFEDNSNPLRECRSCNNRLKLIRAVYYPETEETIRVFECDCGERTWDE
jgi:hypothetical protein